MDLFSLIKKRFSVRAYSDIKVEDVKIQQILQAGNLAPTAHNSQPQRIKVITADEELKKVDGCTPCRFGAPLVFFICYDRETSWKRSFDGKDSGYVDASIVTTHMMLMAEELGLGSCWVMHFDPEKAKELFSLPGNLEPVAFLPTGYPAKDALPSASHEKRRPLEEILI